MLKQSQQFSSSPIDPSDLTVERQQSVSNKYWIIRFCHPTQGPLTWPHIAKLLVQSSTFQQLWNQTWAELPTDVMWKPVPIHPDFLETHPFFVVAVPSSFPNADASAYQSYLNQLGKRQRVAVFPNLSGETQLVVPEKTGDYGHIRSFCQTAPPKLWQDFWRQIGTIAQKNMAKKRLVWCNTHGHGVPWMHVRFDPTHKYPAFPPYGPITKTSQQTWYDSIYNPTYGMQ